MADAEGGSGGAEEAVGGDQGQDVDGLCSGNEGVVKVKEGSKSFVSIAGSIADSNAGSTAISNAAAQLLVRMLPVQRSMLCAIQCAFTRP